MPDLEAVRLRQATQRARRAVDQKADGQPWFRIDPPKLAGEPTRIQIYGFIGDWWEGTDAATLARDIAALETDKIEVHLNSPGGLAYDGIAVYNALRQHSANVTTVVDGLAASAASIIAMAGDTVVMSLGSQLMIHDASTLAYGNAAEMRSAGEMLDKLSQSGADIYAARAGGTAAEWRDRMVAETWYTAQEAVDAGLATQVDTTKPAADPEQSFDLSVFAHAGRSHADAPPLLTRAPKPPATPAEPSTTPKGADMSDKFLTAVRERLGVTDADATEETILAALDQTLDEQTVEPTQTAPAVAELPAGFVAVDANVLAELQAGATQGTEARQEQKRLERRSILDAALADGRLAKASEPKALELLEADDEHGVSTYRDFLASLPKNSAVRTSSSGYTGDTAEASDDEVDITKTDAYQKWSM